MSLNLWAFYVFATDKIIVQTKQQQQKREQTKLK
jgi:hypothetical protein